MAIDRRLPINHRVKNSMGYEGRKLRSNHLHVSLPHSEVRYDGGYVESDYDRDLRAIPHAD